LLIGGRMRRSKAGAMTAARTFEILIAEDNPADVLLVREALKEHGINYALHVFSDGAKMLAHIDQLDGNSAIPRFDLLILDMHLPKHDGEEILKRLRSTEHHAQSPVIVMTSVDSTTMAADAEQHAALFYFRKTSTLDEFMKLGAMVRAILDQRGRSGPMESSGGER
jgi:DNA-binding response OmpR family regulator